MAELRISFETRDLTRIERIGDHSHIRGLSLDSALDSCTISESMVGQISARKAARVILQMIKDSKMTNLANKLKVDNIREHFIFFLGSFLSPYFFLTPYIFQTTC
ncbi:RuvB-like 2 [Linum grandiflorum]